MALKTPLLTVCLRRLRIYQKTAPLPRCIIGLFLDEDDPQQVALFARFEGPLRAFIDNEPEKSPFSHRANQILERYYGDLSH